MEYHIIGVRGHYEAYDNNGNFVCSGDTYTEVVKEMNKDYVARFRLCE